ncbi:MAG: AraC family transcriptional regulator [Cyanobacteria bacterium J06560_2]
MEISLAFDDFQQATESFLSRYGGTRQLARQETILLIPDRFGQGTLHGIHLREGLDLLIHDYQLNCDLTLDFHQIACQDSLVNVSFCLSGQYKGTMPGFRQTLEIVGGQTSLTTVPEVTGTVSVSKREKLRVVELVMAPTLAMELIENSLPAMPTAWQSALKAYASQPFCQTVTLSPKIAKVLQDLLDCPYKDTLRQIYLEGKALELIALYFSRWSMAGSATDSYFNQRTIDSLHQARHLLFENMSTPPSLESLAKQIGMSERKLQQGFRQHFGTTVFGALRDYRMEQARQLLEKRRMSVEAIAHTVGISHRGHFAKVFKRKFGVTPKDYLK